VQAPVIFVVAIVHCLCTIHMYPLHALHIYCMYWNWSIYSCICVALPSQKSLKMFAYLF